MKNLFLQHVSHRFQTFLGVSLKTLVSGDFGYFVIFTKTAQYHHEANILAKFKVFYVKEQIFLAVVTS